MAVVQILKYPDYFLTIAREEFGDLCLVTQIDDDALNLIQDLKDTLNHHNGYGLAARQIGSPKDVIAVNRMWDSTIQDPLIMINPVITRQDGSKKAIIESCFSVPGIEAKVERPEIITVQYTDKDGKDHSRLVSGMEARIIQHEIDHLNGILFIQRLVEKEYKKVQNKINKMSFNKLGKFFNSCP